MERTSVHFAHSLPAEGFSAKICGIHRNEMPKKIAQLSDEEIFKHYSRINKHLEKQDEVAQLRRDEQVLRNKKKKKREGRIRIRRKIRSNKKRDADQLRLAQQLKRSSARSKELAPTPLTEQERMARAAGRRRKRLQSLARRHKKVA
jgi:hypothetical protein